MRRVNKNVMKSIFTMGIAWLTFCVTPQVAKCGEGPSKAESQKESQYYEVEKDGRLYVFTSSARKLDFEKSGELGKGIIKIDHGPRGETVGFDSEGAVVEYEFRLVREILRKCKIKAYREVSINGRRYVFVSPTRKMDFEKSGEPGKAIIKIGHGPHGETVVFDSDEAVKEYDNRHPPIHVQK